LYMRGVNRELPLFIVGLSFAAAEGGARLHLSPLLVSLAAGALIANLDEREGRRIHHAIQQAGLPVFALFFAAAGAGLKLDALVTVGPAALLLVGLRGLAIWAACRKFAPAGDPRLKRYLWMGLISQAGVTFGLAALVSRTFPTFGPQVEVLIVAMITAHELVGPVLTRRALLGSGEIRAEEAGGGA
ncbi:cation:proton antiporter domain-containing protein, partial [Corallococcus terminator]